MIMTKMDLFELEELNSGKIKTVAAGLKEGEIVALDKVAGSLGLARNGLIRYIIRRFLVDYHAGRVTVEVEETITKTPKLP